MPLIETYYITGLKGCSTKRFILKRFNIYVFKTKNIRAIVALKVGKYAS